MASRIADLILRQGDVQAQRELARGQGWGAAVSGLASLPGRVNQANQQQRDADLRRQQVESGLETDALQRTALQAGLDAQAATADEQARMRTLAAKTTRVNDWLTGLAGMTDPAQQQAAYEEGRAALLGDGTLAPEDAPLRFPGASWVKSRLTLTLPAAERFKQLFPDAPKPERVETRNADGSTSIQFVAPKVGTSFTSAPEPQKVTYGAPAEFLVGNQRRTLRPGSDGQYYDDALRVVTGVRPAPAQSTAQPTEYKLVGPNGEQRIVRGVDAANQLLGQGWKQYDATAVRQGNQAPDPEALDTAREVQRIAKALRDHAGFGGTFGIVSSKLPTMRQSTADAEVLLNSLRSLLTLENTGKLKGVLSNADMELLRQASTTLAPQMGEPSARAELNRLGEVMSRVTGEAWSAPGGAGGRGAAGGPGPAGSVSVTAPDGNTYTFPNQAQANAFKRRAGIP